MFKIKRTNELSNDIYASGEYDLYAYTVYTGTQVIDVPVGDSAWVVDSKRGYVYRGGQTIKSTILCVVIRGYQCDEKMSGFESLTNLPYINGCSSHQVFPPVRPGDPTLQLLYLPPNTSEQANHMHPTVRVVYVLSGSGKSVQGMAGSEVKDLNAGDILILDKMTPHHFVTMDEDLVVVSLHVYSSTVLESHHPMLDGTFRVE